MSIRGRWRVVETPGYDMAVAGAYILFDENGGELPDLAVIERVETPDSPHRRAGR